MVNRKFTWFMLMVVLCTTTAFAQKYKSDKSTITFFSEAPLENIDATNKDATSVFDESNSNIVFSVPIKSFVFDKSLMQEHFNEKYLESHDYPKALFTGKVIGFKSDASGEQQVSAKGDMTIHGETQPIEVTGILRKNGRALNLKSTFIIKLEDYKVKIPQVLWQNIAEEVEVKIDFTYKPL